MSDTNLPTLEILEATHSFPGKYMFKAIGFVDRGFAAKVVSAVREELSLSLDPPFRLRESASGKHVAVTLEPTIQTSAEVLQVYQRIRTIEGLVMLF